MEPKQAEQFKMPYAKDCPHCAQEPRLVLKTSTLVIDDPRAQVNLVNRSEIISYLECSACFSTGPRRNTPMEAIEAWNGRLT